MHSPWFTPSFWFTATSGMATNGKAVSAPGSSPLLFGMVASILSGWHDPNDPAGLADAVGRAAATDWRAAAWMLEHHPLTREDFGDLGRDERVRRELLVRVVAAIAAAALAPRG